MIHRWPHSKTPHAPQKVHALTRIDTSLTILRPPPVKLRRSVHAPVMPLRAVDLAPLLRREAALAGPQPCTGVTAAPAHAPEPAAAPIDPYVAAGHPWARVGMRVRRLAHGHREGGRTTVGREYEIIAFDSKNTLIDGRREIWINGDDGYPCWLASDRLEPAPSPAPVEAWTPPAPWVVDGDGDWGYGAPWAASLVPSVEVLNGRWAGQFEWARPGSFKREGAPTLAQAMCCAISIDVVQYGSTGPTPRADAPWFAIIDRDTRIDGPDAEDVARRALAAHARAGKP